MLCSGCRAVSFVEGVNHWTDAEIGKDWASLPTEALTRSLGHPRRGRALRVPVRPARSGGFPAATLAPVTASIVTMQASLAVVPRVRTQRLTSGRSGWCRGEGGPPVGGQVAGQVATFQGVARIGVWSTGVVGCLSAFRDIPERRPDVWDDRLDQRYSRDVLAWARGRCCFRA